jgi:two-component system OmpR family response regulator
MKVLVVEDHNELLEEIISFLKREDMVLEWAENFMVAYDKIAIYEYDIALIDISLPDGSGLELIRFLKEMNPETGIIIISAKNSLDDKLSGLDLGADDYITKPFHFAELNSRIKAVYRRRKLNGVTTIIYNEIEINDSDKTVAINNSDLELTKKEFELLLFFISNKNRVISKDSIAEHLWGDHIDAADSFDFIYTHINNLRKKIQGAGGKDYLKTVYGMGYKFTDI